jgi:hypothetical protein
MEWDLPVNIKYGKILIREDPTSTLELVILVMLIV